MTDYRARKRAITSQDPLLVVRFSNQNVSAQFVRASLKGDLVIPSEHSKELSKLGWRGSLKSTPAYYLLGMLAGKKAKEKGLQKAVLYNGLTPFIKGARVSAFLKGLVESGIEIPVGEEAFPSSDRLTGKEISSFAAKLSKEDEGAYKRVFSGLLKSGFRPEEYPAEFEKTRASIMGDSR